jgi:hypothetical protein
MSAKSQHKYRFINTKDSSNNSAIITSLYFGYYKYAKRLFPNTEDRLLLHKFIEQSSSHFHGNRHINNGMSFDFGMQISQISNMFYITEYIKELDQDFRLVIIAELFDESLVLMKRYLCWDLLPIFWLAQNWYKVLMIFLKWWTSR